MVLLALVAAIGFSCGFATRGKGYEHEGWHTRDVAVLRVVAKIAREKHLRTVRFEGDGHEYWEPTMAILADDLRSSPDPKKADIIVRPDRFGLPSVVEEFDQIGDKGQPQGNAASLAGQSP